MLQLSDKWAAALLGERETGMGYQVVTIRLKDGRRFDGVAVTGGIIASIDGHDHIPFSDSDIAAIHGESWPSSTRILVCHDYGQGGLWAIVCADSAEQVRQRFPGLPVFESPPRRSMPARSR